MQKVPIETIVERLSNNEYFSMAGYSDAEWFSILRHGIGRKTGLGQILDAETGKKLADIMRRRQDDPRFLFAAPGVLWEGVYFIKARITQRINRFSDENDLHIDWYERDMLTDDLAAAAGLYPFINQLQKMHTVLIGNEALADIDFPMLDNFIGISSPNLHLEENGIENAVEEAKRWGEQGVYLVSAGMSAALIIDQLHDEIPNSWFIDCGSMWDAFVGIGGQRGWRAELYKNPKKLEEWKHANIYGPDYQPRD